jgi:hypothetical protein
METEGKGNPVKLERDNSTTPPNSASSLLKLAILVLALLAGAHAFGFGPGDRVKTLSASVVRTGPGAGYTGIFTNQAGVLGIIKSTNIYDGSSFFWCSNQWDNGISGYSAVQNLNAIAPNPPNLVSPGNGNSSTPPVVTNIIPVFNWSSSIGATNYGLYIRNFNTGIMLYSNDYVGNITQLSRSGLTPGDIYKWNMTASDSAAQSDVSASNYFRYVPPPTNILTLSPSSVTATSAVFNASFYPDGTSGYANFKYGTDTSYGTPGGQTTFATSLNSQWMVSSTNTGLSPNTTYHYQIVVANDGGAYNGNDVSFTTATASLPTPPHAIIIGNTTPVTGTTTFYGSASTGQNLQFSWSSANGQSFTSTNAQFQFNAPGQYSVSLTVKDSSAQTSSASVTVNVQAANIGHTTLTVAGADPVVLSTGNYYSEPHRYALAWEGFPVLV